MSGRTKRHSWLGSTLLALLIVAGSSTLVQADQLTLRLTRDMQQSPQEVTSLASMNARVGDVLNMQSEFGQSYDFRIQKARRSALGNQIITGQSQAGANVVMVVTSEGQLQGSIRDGDAAYRLTQEGNAIVWYYLDPSFARPADHGAIVKPRAPITHQRIPVEPGRHPIKLKAQKSLASQDVSYPVFESGLATLDVLFYHEEGMETPEAIADLVTEVTNQAMLDSRIELQVNIVGVKPVDVAATLLQEEVLDQMFEGEGAFTDIESDRSFYDADLVLTLRENIPSSDDACGIAYVGVYDGEPWRKLYTAVVQWLPLEAPGDNYCTDTTTAHEIGHLLGSQHERRISDGSGAYSYSYGYYGIRFHTIMSYGDEPEVTVFSNPDLIACRGGPCGLPEGDPESADNARSFTQTRFMLAGYQSDRLTHELVRDFVIDEDCELDDGGEGFRYGHGLSNDTSYIFDVRAFSVLTSSGEVRVDEFEAGELTLEPNYYLQPFCTELGEESLYGDEYIESWATYVDPLTGNWIESLHLRWDNEYDGTYSRVDIATSDQGSVEGHTTFLVTPEESVLINFVPSAGFALVDVTSSCGGALSGNTFTIEQVTSGCSVEPIFEMSVTPGDTLRIALEEPVEGDTYSGVGNLRGWAVATVGVDRVEIWIDGAYAFDAPYGGARGDVGNIYPDIDNSSQSGYSLAWNYGNMSLGEHVMTARAYNANGQYTESSKTFFVTRFHKAFLGKDDEVNLSGAQCSVTDTQISITDAVMDGSVYDILLEWRTPAQDFQIIEIR